MRRPRDPGSRFEGWFFARLAGKVYDFGDQTLSEHLRDIANELSEQAYINGEEDPSLCDEQPLYDLSDLLERLSVEAQRLEQHK